MTPSRSTPCRKTPSTERLSFNEAVAFVQQTGKAAFAAMPVFGDDENDADATAEGARVFLLLPDEDEGWLLRFIAGPFFTSAYAANDVIPAEEIPERVRELLFMPTRCEDDWLTDQLQVLLGEADPGRRHRRTDAGLRERCRPRAPGPEAVFPVNFIGGVKKPH
jgi:hypothetical protein